MSASIEPRRRATPLRVLYHAALLAVASAGCGARSELADIPPGVDLAQDECAAAAGPSPPFDACGPLAFHLETQASCTIALAGGAGVDAEGFMTAKACHPCTLQSSCDPTEDRPCNRVFVMNRFGAGHVLGFCDGTTLVTLLAELDATGYLGRAASPRVASVGAMWPCPPQLAGIPGATYLGATLPDPYASDPEALAASFDVLIACGPPGESGGPWQSSLRRFVRELGKGLLISEDYMLSCDPTGPEITAVNALTKEAGFVFEPVELTWAKLAVTLPCVADYPP